MSNKNPFEGRPTIKLTTGKGGSAGLLNEKDQARAGSCLELAKAGLLACRATIQRQSQQRRKLADHRRERNTRDRIIVVPVGRTQRLAIPPPRGASHPGMSGCSRTQTW
jgi:hypothetical protein